MQTQIAPYSHFQPQPAMAGLFGWLKRTIRKVATFVQEHLPNPVTAAILDFTSGDGSFYGINFGTIGDGIDNGFLFRQQEGGLVIDTTTTSNNVVQDFDLTIAEEAVLDNWVDNHFTPYFNEILAIIKQAKNVPTQANKITAFNEASFARGLFVWLQGYSKINGQTGFTPTAILARNEFLKIQNEAIVQSLNDAIPGGMPSAKVNLSVTAQEVAGLNINTPQVFTIAAYQVNGTQTNNGNDITIIDETITDSNTGVVQTPTTTTSGSISTGKIALALVAMAILYKVTKKNKKK